MLTCASNICMLLLLQVDILRDTVMGALNAALPIGTKRTIYLCDDLPGEHSRSKRVQTAPERVQIMQTAESKLHMPYWRWMAVHGRLGMADAMPAAACLQNSP